MSDIEKYEYSVKIRDTEVKYRKWKVKDKKKFMSSNDDKMSLKEALVYDCLEDKTIALSDEEFKYMLIKIRETSLEDKVHYTFKCGFCSEIFDFTADLNEVMTPDFKPYGDIIYKDKIFTMGNLQNREFYEGAIASAENAEEKTLIDFILHVKSYNDDDGYTFAQMNEIINNLDVNTFENIFKKWEEMRFKVNNVYAVTCPHCNQSEYYEFDDLPGFFPESWDKQ